MDYEVDYEVEDVKPRDRMM